MTWNILTKSSFVSSRLRLQHALWCVPKRKFMWLHSLANDKRGRSDLYLPPEPLILPSSSIFHSFFFHLSHSFSSRAEKLLTVSFHHINRRQLSSCLHPKSAMTPISMYESMPSVQNRYISNRLAGFHHRHWQHRSSWYTSTHLFHWARINWLNIGIGAGDVTKLKAHGYFTVAVRFPFFRRRDVILILFVFAVCAWCDSQDFAEDQRVQWDQGWEDQGGYSEMFGRVSFCSVECWERSLTSVWWLGLAYCEWFHHCHGTLSSKKEGFQDFDWQ